MKRCLAALVLLEMLEEEENRFTIRGKTRHWIKRRGVKGYFNNIVREIEDTAPYSLIDPKFPFSYLESAIAYTTQFSVLDGCFAISFSICEEIACTFFGE